MEILLVDGYNVINFCPDLFSLPDNLEIARDKLVDILLEYGAYKEIKIIVVFDAHLAKGQGEEIIHAKHLKVIYTREEETADSRIERLSYQLAKEKNRVFVVTSDQAEQMTVLGAGAFRMSAREFLADLLKVKNQIRREISEKEAQGKRHELAKHLADDIYSRLDIMRRK
ncbi:MAG: NYN domain-containing protein [Sporomusaceae bacterium]|jgi:predicted RNA-binding protein with PIN domain|nr:NYN domain-containing protein [Sporomusaceae bacterium]